MFVFVARRFLHLIVYKLIIIEALAAFPMCEKNNLVELVHIRELFHVMRGARGGGAG